MKKIFFFALVIVLLSLGLVPTTVSAADTTVTVTVLDSQGNPLAGVPVAYQGSYYVSFGTTNASGVATKDLPSGTYTFKATYQNTSAEQTQDIGANPGLTFYTSKSQVQVYKSDGSAFAGVRVLFSPSSGFGNYISVNTDTTGLAKTELFPGTIWYKAITNNTSAVQSAVLPGNGTIAGQSGLVTFYTSKSVAQVQNCDGVALAGIAIKFFGGGYPGNWASATTDAAGLASIEEFPGTWKISASLNNTSEVKDQLLPGDGMTPGQSTTTIFNPTKVTFVGVSPISYWIGYWTPFTSPGYMFPATVKFRLGGAGGTEVDLVISGCSFSYPASNQPPVANGQSVTADEDTDKAITLTGSDVDGDSLTYSIVAPPSHGSLTGTPPDLTYTPNLDYNGPDSFTFKANDGTADSNVATVSITVNSVNDPPVADAGPDQNDVEQTSYAGAEVTLDGSGSSDVDGDTLTYDWTWSGGSTSGETANATFPLGTTTVTLTVSDGELSDTDTVDIEVVDTTPPEVTIGSPENNKTYLNTQGPIPVQYTATDICDSDLTITMTLDGNPFTGDEINLCGMASGEHPLVISAADDSGNTGTDSAIFNVAPQSLKTFTINHMVIQWSRPGIWGRFDKDTFLLSGRLQIPEGCTVEDLNKSATLTIAISDASGTDTVLCKVRPLNKAGTIWKYNGKEQPPGEGMNIHNLIIWWTPQSGKWAGWAGLHISGVLQLPDEIGVNTKPAEAKVTLELPVATGAGCGSLVGEQTVKFVVLERSRLWLYNAWHNLPGFPCDPTGAE